MQWILLSPPLSSWVKWNYVFYYQHPCMHAVLCVCENTDPNCYRLTNYIEVHDIVCIGLCCMISVCVCVCVHAHTCTCTCAPCRHWWSRCGTPWQYAPTQEHERRSLLRCNTSIQRNLALYRVHLEQKQEKNGHSGLGIQRGCFTLLQYTCIPVHCI